MNIFYQSPFDYRTKVISTRTSIMSPESLRKLILEKEGLESAVEFTIFHNGKLLNRELNATQDVFIQVGLVALGGKGGFGSMLRAIGAQIEKTTNREACRDLSGRRLRDVNEEKRIKEWIKKQAQRKEEEKKKKEKLKRLAEGGTALPGSYDDPEFEKFRTEIPDIVEESIKCGLKQQERKKADKTEEMKKPEEDEESVTKTTKRKLEPEQEAEQKAGPSTSITSLTKDDEPSKKKLKSKKPILWLGIDASTDTSDDSDED